VCGFRPLPEGVEVDGDISLCFCNYLYVCDVMTVEGSMLHGTRGLYVYACHGNQE